MSGSGHHRLLRILHIDPERNWGGGEVQVLGLASCLSEKGHRNDLLAHPEGRLFDRAQGLPIRTFPLVVRNDFDLRPIRSLRRLIRNERYDVVHLHTKRAHALALWLPRSAGGPKYVVTRRMDYAERAGWYTQYLYGRRVDGVVAISGSVLSALISAGVAPERIRLIHDGIDADRFRPAAGRPRQSLPVISAIAVLEERKGHRVLLEAAARLKAQGHHAKYLLAGEGSLRSELQRQAERLGLAEEARFLGFVADPVSVLAKTDLFVMPSISEGLGVAALEAMAAGKAVIASRVGGLAEVIVDGVTGLLVAPGNPAELASAIARLLKQPKLAEELGTKAAEHVRRHFTIEQTATKNEGYYYELLRRPVA